MANQVYANGMEVSCKAANGKTICAFPDVCFTPPETPATPTGVPIPYPNTGMASDTTSGSTAVKISGKEVMLKNKSYFKTSYGDEAGCAAKKGVLTSVNRGKVYFNAWSMDVKVEGENVVRMLDITTHNHASLPGNSPTWPYIDETAEALDAFDDCEKDKKKINDNCEEDGSDQCPGFLAARVGQQRAKFEAYGEGEDEVSRTEQAAAQSTVDAESNDCVKAMRCYLRPYTRSDKKGGCCPGQTPHHVPPKSMVEHLDGYSMGSALCVCFEGANQHCGSHGENHAALDYLANKPGVLKDGCCSLKKYNEICAKSLVAQCGCSQKCIEAQLNEQFKEDLTEPVEHWQSNSVALGDTKKLDKAFNAGTQKAKG